MFNSLLSLLVISSKHFVDNLIISKHFVDNLTYRSSSLMSLLVIISKHFVDNLTYRSNSLMSLLVIISKHFVDNLTYIFLIIFLPLHVCRQSLYCWLCIRGDTRLSWWFSFGLRF
jgi:hypothetical protein